MDPLVLFFAFAFSIGVGYWANNWGRNGWGWGVAALFFSPLITAIVLMFAGKTLDKKAEEQAYIQGKINK